MPLVFHVFIAVAIMVCLVAIMSCGHHGMPCGHHVMWPSWYRPIILITPVTINLQYDR